MLETGECQPEVIQAMIERLARDGDAERAGVGKVGQPHPSRLVVLAKDHVLLWTVQCPPRRDASRIRVNPGIFARLRSFAYNILRINETGSFVQDRYRAALRGVEGLLQLAVC